MRKLFFIATLFAIFSACQKDDDSNQNQTPEPDYFPMAIGNYWVYERVTKDSASNETANETLDSVFIRTDTIINDKKYFVF